MTSPRIIRTTVLVTLLLCSLLQAPAEQVGEWTSHLAYNNVTEIVRLGDRIYALAGGAMFSVDMADETTTYHNKQNGLHGANITHIAGNGSVRRMVVFYDDGLIDLMDEDGSTHAVTDLQLKDMSETKSPNSIFMNGEYAYCSMSFGILVLNLKKKETADVYYIGEDGKSADILQTAVLKDSIYAVSDTKIYSASLKDNLLDYNSWHTAQNQSGKGQVQNIAVSGDRLWLLQGGELWCRRQAGQWQQAHSGHTFTGLRCNKRLFGIAEDGVFQIDEDELVRIPVDFTAVDFLPTDGGLWMAAKENGVAFHTQDGTNFYRPDGPAQNIPFRMRVAYGKLYVVPGGRWSSQYGYPGCVMIYDGQQWTNISNSTITAATYGNANDFMNVAVDPMDHEHFFVTSYGMGLYEFRGTQPVHHYTYGNSPLMTAAPGPSAGSYVRIDGAMFDGSGNLWLINTGASASTLHIISQAQMQIIPGQAHAVWDTLNIYTATHDRIVVYTPQEMFTDNRDEKRIWIPHARSQAGLILLDHNGTPAYQGDDKAVFRNEFTDQDNNTIRPEAIYCAVQDRNGTVWVGHQSGVFIIPEDVDFMRSNACERVKIPRNDGTNLADYLLNGEQVNAIAVDGSNRKWIGTETSGLYLMSEDGVETIEHFTTDNSPLLSDKIISLAINPVTGIVYVGTEVGLISYQSDASDPMPDYSAAYAYPNPVREDYDGVITLTGLMDETTVHILDSGGNLVCETHSNGGIAVWDGRNGAGRKVSSGVYTALCNTADGSGHTMIKILVIH